MTMAYYKLFSFFLFVNYFSLSPVIAKEECPFDVEGLIAPVFTTVYDNGTLNLGIIPAYAQYLKDNDIDGICVGGYTGEGPTLGVAEMKTLISAWLDAIEYFDMTAIAVIGGRPFPDVIELAKYSEKVGLDAIVTLPDLFYKPATAEDLVYTTEIIANAAPNTPLIYYDVPKLTNVNVDIAEFFTLATERIPTFKAIGIDNCDDGPRILPLIQPDQKIFITNSTFAAVSVYLGNDNFCFTELNIFPDLIRDIISNATQAKLNETNSIFEELLDLTNTILSVGEEIPAFKAAMTLLTGIDVGPPRNPEQELDEDEEIDLEEKLKDKGQAIIIPDDDDK